MREGVMILEKKLAYGREYVYKSKNHARLLKPFTTNIQTSHLRKLRGQLVPKTATTGAILTLAVLTFPFTTLLTVALKGLLYNITATMQFF